MLDERGFKRKTYNELLDEIQNETRLKFGEDINLSITSPLGISVYLYAWFLNIVWGLAESVYYSGFISTATGASLDRLLPYGGTRRIQAEYATGDITITGTANTTIPAGFVVSTPLDVFYETIDDCTLNSEGVGTVGIQAVEIGPSGNVLANTITVVVNPDANVTSVTNAEATSGGRSKETDEEARARYLSIESRGASTIDSIYSAVIDVPGVRTVRVFENDTDTADSSGRPPHSFETLVLGGEVQDVAEAIFSKKPAGIQSHGSTTATVTDLSGTARTVKFSYATVQTIHVRATVTRDNTFPEDGAEQIRTQILQYIGGLDASGDTYPGLGLGEDVILSTCIRNIKVEGITDIVVEFSINGTSYSAANIDVGNNVANTDYSKVVIALA